MLDAYFVADILVNFRRGYRDPEREVREGRLIEKAKAAWSPARGPDNEAASAPSAGCRLR